MSTENLLYADVTEKIIGAAFTVHNTLGPGHSEKTYENALALKLRELGFLAEQQKAMSVFFQGTKVGEQIADILVEDKVVVETKAVHKLQNDFETKLLGCLKSTKYQVGLLINFSTKVEFKRLVHSAQNK